MPRILGEGVISIDGDLTNYEIAMNKSPEAARKASELAQREMGKIDRAAEAAALKTSAVFLANFKKVSQAGAAMGSKVSGSLGAVGELANSALIPLGEVVSSLGSVGIAASVAAAGVLALPAAILGVVGATTLLANAAVDARERLQEQGVILQDTDNLDRYEQSTRDLSLAFDELTVSLGNEFGGELAVILVNVQTGINAFGDLRESTEGFRRGLQAVVSLGWTEIVRAGWVQMTEQERATIAATEAIRDHTKALAAASTAAATFQNEMEEEAQEAIRVGQHQQQLADDREALAKQGAAAAARAERERVTAHNKAVADILAADKAYWTEVDRTAAAHLQAVNDAFDFSQGQKELQDLAAEADRAGYMISLIVTEAETQRQKDLLNSIRDAVLDFAMEITGAISMGLDTEVQKNQEAIDKIVSDRDRLVSRQEDIHQTIEDLQEEQRNAETQDEKDRIAATIAQYQQEQLTNQMRIKSDNDAAEALRENQRKLWKAQQATAYGEAILGASLAIIQCFAQLGPIFGAIAAVGVGITTGFEINAIANAPVPEFPMGRPSSDHTIAAMLQPGEPVINRRGNKLLEDALGPGAAGRLNQGEQPGAGGIMLDASPELRRFIRSRQLRDPRLGKGRAGRPRRG